MKRTSNILIVAALATGAFLAACNRGEHNRKPGRIYMPDMYESRAYEFYSARLSGLKPVEGTVKRGELLPYHLKESDTAQANLVKNPLTITATDLKEGERLFNIYCGICHGTALDGNGPLYKGGDGPYPAAPANLVAGAKAGLTEGRIFHVITYGYNMMGSYASQLDREQRWKVVAYIQSKKAGASAPAAEAAPAGDSTAAK
ncbi:mono/diheme cytochrome c family protein [Chitinophaga terrae (ex Kim and Jung 2007)]|jgi:mono/diheme cytochrome c family protein|uniref:c-type cytochrome n=1 Tax=Chitinophaga terrae (ex Kim and Jung 2007) TaxID=408074 RepID=UPI00278482CE|nr:cytochrome c [Chitinophaga terrae (ex Kim and Jung 2007)]MDQ0105004.1 mono/diheme cytochrome c family protein [Chitinophaga terrae (ex Kim and Jung 2007)]